MTNDNVEQMPGTTSLKAEFEEKYLLFYNAVNNETATEDNVKSAYEAFCIEKELVGGGVDFTICVNDSSPIGADFSFPIREI